MAEFNAATLRQQIQQQYRWIQSLQMAVYTQSDPATYSDLYRQLAQAESQLHALEQQAAAMPVARVEDRSTAAPRGRFLGPKTTGLRVQPTLHMHPLPTGVYHLLDPETDPLLTVMVGNESRDTRRVCVKVFLEGLSAQAVRTVEVEPREEVTLKLLPTLLPERARAITEVQRRDPARPGRGPGRQAGEPRHLLGRLPGPHLQLQRRPPARHRRAGRPVALLRRLGHAARRAGPAADPPRGRPPARPADLGLPGRSRRGPPAGRRPVPGAEGGRADLHQLGDRLRRPGGPGHPADPPAAREPGRPRRQLHRRRGPLRQPAGGRPRSTRRSCWCPATPSSAGRPGTEPDEWRYLETTMIGTPTSRPPAGRASGSTTSTGHIGPARLTVHRLADLRAAASGPWNDPGMHGGRRTEHHV